MNGLLFIAAGTIWAALWAPSDPYASTAEAMRAELGNGFRVVREGCFVVGSDLEGESLAGFRERILKECSEALFREFFEKRPDYPIRAYLFKDAAGYTRYVERSEGRAPTTPFGYFQPARKALVMDISTGGGTLVHEMVHALIQPDFPSVPAWFNEGLGSLFEQCRTVEGRLRGLPNWRLRGLKSGLEAGSFIPFERLIGMSDAEFYGEERGMAYAEARYLCFYLQEKGLLARFYKAFRGRARKDPTGRKSFRRVVTRDLPAFEKEWKAWVGTLKFP